MKLKILGSNSTGNCYLFMADDTPETLIVECGVSLKEVKKALDYDIRRVVGAVVTHEHGDHAKAVSDFLDMHISVYMSSGTANTLKEARRAKTLGSMDTIKLGNFTIKAFDVKHDAAEPFGYLIFHPEMGLTLFATDTCYLKHTFKGLSNVLIECNYRHDILERNISGGKLPASMYARIVQNHMSYNTCAEALQTNDLRFVNNIVLMHLSDGNSNATEFKTGITQLTGKTVYVADRGMCIDFNKTPF